MSSEFGKGVVGRLFGRNHFSNWRVADKPRWSL